jgi:hypothetical protein
MDPHDLEISILMVNINNRFFEQLNANDLTDTLKIALISAKGPIFFSA